MGVSISELADLPLPPAYKGPRGAILVALKRAGSLTARELGEQLGLSSNAIRHHLRELETDGVIAYRREQRGVGAPTYAWHLSPSGEALFPQRYKELLTEVLERVADTLGMLGLGVPRRVVQEQTQIIQQLASGVRKVDETTLLDIAGALLYVEASLDDKSRGRR